MLFLPLSCDIFILKYPDSIFLQLLWLHLLASLLLKSSDCQLKLLIIGLVCCSQILLYLTWGKVSKSVDYIGHLFIAILPLTISVWQKTLIWHSWWSIVTVVVMVILASGRNLWSIIVITMIALLILAFTSHSFALIAFSEQFLPFLLFPTSSVKGTVVGVGFCIVSILTLMWACSFGFGVG